KLNNLLNEFQENILYDHPSIPCAYCSILIMNQTTNWIDYDTTEEYTLPIAFPNIKITRRYPPILSSIPEEINIPIIYRKNLSPIHMNCTLGRTLRFNPYTNYRHLKRFINLSKNKYALQLHSGLIGAFLNQEQEDSPNWFHPTLIPASQWLKENNPIFKEYNHLSSFESPKQNITNQPYPIARLTNIYSWSTQN
ncbi:5125_t:CDS:2, partial [Funneliformis mosseae]